MARQARIISSTGIYHIIQRGINRGALFFDNNDYCKYRDLLLRYSLERKYDILAFCLMKNHVHLLMNFHNDPPGDFVRKISVSYSFFFNKKYDRTGHLFQNRFKSSAVEDDQYLLTVVNYIHKNPEKAGVCKAEDYKWSSFNEYINTAQIVNTEPVIGIVGDKEAYIRSFVESGQYIENVNETGRITDPEAFEIIRSVIGDNVRMLKIMNREIRDKMIEDIIRQGVSAAQLSRITGLSRSTIEKWRRRKRPFT